MKTKTFSNNRVTRSHTARSSELAMPCTRVSQSATVTAADATVSKRDSDAILRQAKEIRANWTNAERDERAQMGAQRRAELCQLLFGAN